MAVLGSDNTQSSPNRSNNDLSNNGPEISKKPPLLERVGVSHSPPVPCGGGGWRSRLITKSRCFQLSNQTIPVHCTHTSADTRSQRATDSLRRNILHPLYLMRSSLAPNLHDHFAYRHSIHRHTSAICCLNVFHTIQSVNKVSNMQIVEST